MVRVRFAPSPTGYLHIGGARTALFNWLFARHHQGKFILRIEDTDKRRSKKIYLDEILDSLKWLSLEWDEIYFQSKRFSLYREFAEKLLKEDRAYLEKSKIENRKPKTEAIILKVVTQKVKINDLIHGEIEFDTSVFKDQVLIKSDGTPTYNFACVIDDATMDISHVIRGDDHISNTPKQILIYQALGFSLPLFAHLPLILGKEGGRLSKRTGATAISDYRKLGYLAEGLVNYLLLLGWSPGDDVEIIDIQEAAKVFKIEDANKTAATFDLDKLKWVNSQYIKRRDPAELLELVIPLLIKRRFIKKDNLDRNELLNIIKLFQARISTSLEFLNYSDFFFLKFPKFDKEAEKKWLARDLSKEFSLLIDYFRKLNSFDPQSIEQALRDLADRQGLKAAELIHPIRVALTGKTIGPGLFELISLLGKEKTEQRLNLAIKRWQAKTTRV